MLGEHHDLAQEFPQLKDRIHELKMSDAHFAKLHREYEELDKEIYRAEEQIDARGDTYVESLKKKRVLLKDQLYTRLNTAP